MFALAISVTVGAEANPVVPSSNGTGFIHGQWVKSSGGSISAVTNKSDITHTHVGLDISAIEGSAIKAFAPGVVKKVIDKPTDCNPRIAPKPEWCYLGYMVMIEHTEVLERTFYTLYLHMAEPPLVSKNSDVVAQQTIGSVGRTGVAGAPHLHFEIRFFPSVLYPPWGNIYGPGDQTKSTSFLNEWLDPQKMIDLYPLGLSRSVMELNSSADSRDKSAPSDTSFEDEALHVLLFSGTILIMLSGLALMLSMLIPRRIAARFFSYGIACVVLAAFLSSMGPSWTQQFFDFLSTVPLWIIVIVGGLLAISAMQAFVALFLGWNAAASFAGNLTAALFKGAFTILLAPLRLMKRFLGDEN